MRWPFVIALCALAACGGPLDTDRDGSRPEDVAPAIDGMDAGDGIVDGARDGAIDGSVWSDARGDGARGDDGGLDGAGRADGGLARDAVGPDGAARDASAPDGAIVACPDGMALVAGRVCVDRYEASLVEVLADGSERPWAPWFNPGTTRVRAVSRGGVHPQGYISGEQSARACAEAGKRLCRRDEWLAACQGPARRTYPFGDAAMPGACNVGRRPHPLVSFYGRSDSSIYTFANMNNPGINQQPNALARAGEYARCVSADGLFDLYGNLHEWIAEPEGTFKGGFYGDTDTNGPGCLYTTTAHTFTYRDYSTGFRCCRDPR